MLTGNNSPQSNNLTANLRQIKQRINGLRAMQNPSAAAAQMVRNNPYFQQAAQYVAQNGGNEKAAMEKLLRERGVDPREVYDALR